MILESPLLRGLFFIWRTGRANGSAQARTRRPGMGGSGEDAGARADRVSKPGLRSSQSFGLRQAPVCFGFGIVVRLGRSRMPCHDSRRSKKHIFQIRLRDELPVLRIQCVESGVVAVVACRMLLAGMLLAGMLLTGMLLTGDYGPLLRVGRCRREVVARCCRREIVARCCRREVVARCCVPVVAG